MSLRLINAHDLLMNRPLVMSHLASRDALRLKRTIFFQDEHNLVLPGGRSVSPDDPPGTVRSIFDPADTYLVRVVNARRYLKSDIVIEYNVPNIENLRRSRRFPPDVLDRIVYAPSIPWPYSRPAGRTIDVLTNFIDASQPRRAEFAARLATRVPGYGNVQGVFDLAGLQRLYGSAKIVVNPHQTWHHHSIEEFRVLPALAQGCIVVSEDVPLRETIPYHEFVLWGRYQDLPDLVATTLADYDRTFARIHGTPALAKRLEDMQREFAAAMDRALARGRRRPAWWPWPRR